MDAGLAMPASGLWGGSYQAPTANMTGHAEQDRPIAPSSNASRSRIALGQHPLPRQTNDFDMVDQAERRIPFTPESSTAASRPQTHRHTTARRANATEEDAEFNEGQEDANDGDYQPEEDAPPTTGAIPRPSRTRPWQRYETCHEKEQRLRDKVVLRIEALWTSDPTSWPTHAVCPTPGALNEDERHGFSHDERLRPHHWARTLLSAVFKLADETRPDQKPRIAKLLRRAVEERRRTSPNSFPFMYSRDAERVLREVQKKKRQGQQQRGAARARAGRRGVPVKVERKPAVVAARRRAQGSALLSTNLTGAEADLLASRFSQYAHYQRIAEEQLTRLPGALKSKIAGSSSQMPIELPSLWQAVVPEPRQPVPYELDHERFSFG
ncbi:Hypothetical predicted protein [Lecanosticta acicola]|uniref:Uncharacterized protein n=1 Tax=Lecanosticta acicola TaxID=111012 RepID=A0AAI8Z885_9PEZI|nr:Hypothetical predicted protein [Lecanosticta acicola]